MWKINYKQKTTTKKNNNIELEAVSKVLTGTVQNHRLTVKIAPGLALAKVRHHMQEVIYFLFGACLYLT